MGALADLGMPFPPHSVLSASFSSVSAGVVAPLSFATGRGGAGGGGVEGEETVLEEEGVGEDL